MIIYFFRSVLAPARLVRPPVRQSYHKSWFCSNKPFWQHECGAHRFLPYSWIEEKDRQGDTVQKGEGFFLETREFLVLTSSFYLSQQFLISTFVVAVTLVVIVVVFVLSLSSSLLSILPFSPDLPDSVTSTSIQFKEVCHESLGLVLFPLFFFLFCLGVLFFFLFFLSYLILFSCLPRRSIR